MPDFYISFATDEAFLGATVVSAPAPELAVRVATMLGLNPGGQAAVLPAFHPEMSQNSRDELASYKGRLVGADELMGNGARKLGEMSDDVQQGFASVATMVCEDCNVVGRDD